MAEGFIAVNRRPKDLGGATIQFARDGSADTGTFSYDSVSDLSKLGGSVLGLLGEIQAWFGDSDRDWYPDGEISTELLLDEAPPYLAFRWSFSHSGSPQAYTLTVSSAFQSLFGFSASEGPASTITSGACAGTALCDPIVKGRGVRRQSGSSASSRSGGWTLGRTALDQGAPDVELLAYETEMAAIDEAFRGCHWPRLVHVYETHTGAYPLLMVGQLSVSRAGQIYRVNLDSYGTG